ncbi:MAG: class I SAM-dependent methyltransferase [Nocardioides sp.]
MAHGGQLGGVPPAAAEAGQRLLDVGSGPGTITADLARLVAPGPVTALEVSEQTAALTRAELERRGHRRRGAGRRCPGDPSTTVVRRGARPPGAAPRGRPGPVAA